MTAPLNEKILSYLIPGAFFLLLPLLIYPPAYDVILPVRSLFLCVLLPVTGALMLRSGAQISPGIGKGTSYLLLAWVMLSAISVLWAEMKLDAIWDAGKWILLAGWFFLFGIYIRKMDPDLKKTFALSSISLFILSSGGLLQYSGLLFNNIPPMDRAPYFTMGNVNLYGSAIFFLIPFAGCGIVLLNGWKRIFSIISVLLAVSVLLATHSDAVLLALGTGLLFLFISLPDWTSFGKTFAGGRIRSWKFRMGLLLLLIAGAGTWALSSGKLNQFGHLIVRAWDEGGKGINPRSGSTEERIILWKHSLDMWKEKPLTGTGAGNWKYQIGKYGVKGFYLGYGTRFYTRPHNEFLGTLAERGIVGFLIFCSLFLLTLRNFLVVIRRSENQNKRKQAAIFAAGFLGMIVICFFSFPLDRLFHAIILLSMVGISDFFHSEFRAPGSSIPARWVRAVMITALITALAGIYPATKRLIGDTEMLKLTEAQLSQNWSGMLKHAELAENAFYLVEPMAATPIPWYQGVAHFYLNQFPEALEDFQRAYEIHPHHVQVMQNLGSAFIKTNQIQKGVEMYELTLSLYPDFDECRKNLCQVYDAIGKYPELRRTVNYWGGKRPGMGLTFYYQNMIKRLDSLQRTGVKTF